MKPSKSGRLKFSHFLVQFELNVVLQWACTYRVIISILGLHAYVPIFKTRRIDVYFISYKCNMNSKNDNDRFPIIYCLKYPYFSRSLSVQYMCYYLTLSRISNISPSESGSLSSFVDNKCIVIDYVWNFRSSIKIAKTKVFVLCTKYRGITNDTKNTNFC